MKMTRSFSQTLSFSRPLPPKSSTPSSPLLFLRSQSNHFSSHRNNDLSDLSDSASPSSDPLLRKLEDAIYRIIVRRSAPDWLPFVPGASYWVPPPRFPDEESTSTRNIRGWPSSAYFVKGASSHPAADETICDVVSDSEDEEG